MKDNTGRLCGNKSSTKVLGQMHVAHDAGSSKETTKFVNHGLLLWNQGRQKWIEPRKPARLSRLFHVPKLRTLSRCNAKRFLLCGWNESENRCLESSMPFPKPIPLSEMVGLLVDIWEQEGT